MSRQAREASELAASRAGSAGRMVKGPLITLLLMAIAGCGGAQAPPPGPSSSLPTDPIAQMEIAFEGYPSQREIHALLDPAMNLTGLSITTENQSRAGDVLVTLRKGSEVPITEMDILECMPHRLEDSRVEEHTFVTVSAVCATDLQLGQYP